MGSIAGIAGGAMGLMSSLTGGQESSSSSQQSSKSWPVVIPRLPAVFPNITTPDGSYIRTSNAALTGGAQPYTAGAGGMGLSGLPRTFDEAGNVIGGLVGQDATAGGRISPRSGRTEEEIKAEMNELWGWVSTPGVNILGGEGGSNIVEAMNKQVDPGRWERLEQELQEAKYAPPEDALQAIDIEVGLSPKIESERQENLGRLDVLQADVEQSVADTRAIIDTVKSTPLPDLSTEEYERFDAAAQQQYANLDAASANLQQLYDKIGGLASPFIEARTAPLMESREAAKRDAHRRGVAGPLAALATNPYDQAIADERAQAAKEIADAQLAIRDQQLEVEQQRNVVWRGEVDAQVAEFAERYSRFEADLARGVAAGELESVVVSAQNLISSIIGQRGQLGAQLLTQELAALGIGQEMAQLIINSQLPQTTAQMSESYGSSESESSGGGDILGGIGKIAGGLGSLFGGGGGSS